MTASKRRVALVSAPGEMRTALARYLEKSGFDVHACEELAVPSGFGAVVVISAQDASADAVVANVRSWIKVTRSQRVVVVTSKPTALRDLLATHGDRLHVLAAPAFGWDLIDAIRATEPSRPRGA